MPASIRSERSAWMPIARVAIHQAELARAPMPFHVESQSKLAGDALLHIRMGRALKSSTASARTAGAEARASDTKSGNLMGWESTARSPDPDRRKNGRSATQSLDATRVPAIL
jgi:hypothetical protein